MPIVVMKFGGTSVRSVERISAVADRVVHAREAGSDVIVVVSAMGHTTDEFLAMAARITEVPDPASWTCSSGGRASRCRCSGSL